MDLSALPRILFFLVTILVSLTVHEYAHGLAAWYYGDNTAKDQGRLTLNPLKHLDVLGTIVFLLTTSIGLPFGWAKAIPINPMNLANPRKDMTKVALAGPLANLAMALVFIALFSILNLLFGYNELLLRYQFLIILINVGLAIFNLIPIYPLDGEKVLLGILPLENAIKLKSASKYISRIFWGSSIIILAFVIIT